MGRMVFVTVMPSSIALLVAPTHHQPDICLVIYRTHDFHAKKACRVIDKVGPFAKGASHMSFAIWKRLNATNIGASHEAAMRVTTHWRTLNNSNHR